MDYYSSRLLRALISQFFCCVNAFKINDRTGKEIKTRMSLKMKGEKARGKVLLF